MPRVTTIAARAGILGEKKRAFVERQLNCTLGKLWQREERVRSNSAMNTFVLEALHVKYLTYVTPPTKRFPGVLINKELIALILIYVPTRLFAAFYRQTFSQ